MPGQFRLVEEIKWPDRVSQMAGSAPSFFLQHSSIDSSQGTCFEGVLVDPTTQKAPAAMAIATNVIRIAFFLMVLVSGIGRK